jgi:hypothetical protein
MELDNIVAALGHRDRVRSIDLVTPQKKTLVVAMQVPFPELAYLEVSSFALAMPSRFVLGWIRPTSTDIPADKLSVSGSTEPTFVCQRPR